MRGTLFFFLWPCELQGPGAQKTGGPCAAVSRGKPPRTVTVSRNSQFPRNGQFPRRGSRRWPLAQFCNLPNEICRSFRSLSCLDSYSRCWQSGALSPAISLSRLLSAACKVIYLQEIKENTTKPKATHTSLAAQFRAGREMRLHFAGLCLTAGASQWGDGQTPLPPQMSDDVSVLCYNPGISPSGPTSSLVHEQGNTVLG